jgi:type III secretion protein V
MKTLDALPLGALTRHPDVALAILIAGVCGMMILPLPSLLVDVLLATNLAFAALILVAAVMAERPLAMSTFPSLLLITTLFRLALNVSTTRMILSQGRAGDVVEAFGRFVVRGELVVGCTVFLVITLVQFLVIAKGAERVAEVGARFTLDAMPGKQMSIDAALRAGAISDDEAQAKRLELGRESQFYGAMDGAMKFVKGDAIAGLVIIALNLIAGLTLGVVRDDLELARALDTYAILAVGDGLVSQIPALLITVAAGVLTTRVDGRGKNDLAASLREELSAQPKVLFVGAGFALALGLIPGLPLLPFAIIGAVLAIAGARARSAKHKTVEATQAEGSFQRSLDKKVQQAKAQRAAADNVAPAVPPIGIDLDRVLSQALGFGPGVSDADTELLGALIPQLRDAMYLETGIRFPGIRVRSNVPELPAKTCVVRIKDVPVLETVVEIDRAMAVESPARLKRLGVEATAAPHPLSGIEVGLVPLAKQSALEAAGVSAWSPAGVVALHLAAQLKKNARAFVGLQETAEMIERLEKVYPALVRETVPKIVSLRELTDVLRRLADEGISIRDLKTVLECLADHAGHQNDGVMLTESVRSAMALQIGHAYAGLSGRLSVVLLDPALEDAVRSAITHVPGGSYVALEPELRRGLLQAVARTLQPVVRAGVRPIILTHAEIRRYLRKLLEEDLPDVAVLSFSELPPQMTVQPLGRVTLSDSAVS